MTRPAYLGILAGVGLCAVLAVRADLPAMLAALSLAGFSLCWLVPYRLGYFALYAVGWQALLRPFDPARRAGLGYLYWVTTVREAVDRLLPVASVGGSVVGVRLLRWRGIGLAPAGATVLVEILLTLIVLYAFIALGLCVLIRSGTTLTIYRTLVVGFALSVPIPIAALALARHGSVFERLLGFLQGLIGADRRTEAAAALDRDVRACLSRVGTLGWVGALQFVAVASGAFEVWFALRAFGHPVGAGAALVLESMTQAVRHIAFVVPAGLGVQEAGLVLFGHAFGIGADLALAVSMAKRLREVACGVPPLVAWQWLEARRLRAAPGPDSAR